MTLQHVLRTDRPSLSNETVLFLKYHEPEKKATMLLNAKHRFAATALHGLLRTSDCGGYTEQAADRHCCVTESNTGNDSRRLMLLLHNALPIIT